MTGPDHTPGRRAGFVLAGLLAGAAALTSAHSLVDGLAPLPVPFPGQLAAGAGRRLPPPGLDGPRRLLLLLADGPLPAGEVRVAAPAGGVPWALASFPGPERALPVALTGFDPVGLAAPGSFPWTAPPAEGLIEAARDQGADLHVFGPGAWAAAAGPRLRTLDRVEPEEDPAGSPAGEVLARLAARARTEPAGRKSELWIARLHGEAPAGALASALAAFMERGQALAVHLPLEPGPDRIHPARVLGRGLAAPGPLVSELEDLAPSLAMAMGWAPPGAALGVARPDLLVPDDPRGAWGAMSFGASEAEARRRALAGSLGRPVPAPPDTGPAQEAYRAGRFREACGLLAAAEARAREALRQGQDPGAGREVPAWAPALAALGSLAALGLGAAGGGIALLSGFLSALAAGLVGLAALGLLDGREPETLRWILAAGGGLLLPGVWLAGVAELPLLAGVASEVLDPAGAMAAGATALGLALAGGAFRLAEGPAGLGIRAPGVLGPLASLGLAGLLLWLPLLALGTGLVARLMGRRA